MGLTLEEANRILRGTLAKAQELNIKISAAICDPGGHAGGARKGRLPRGGRPTGLNPRYCPLVLHQLREFFPVDRVRCQSEFFAQARQTT
jgi:hypothetical protein